MMEVHANISTGTEFGIHIDEETNEVIFMVPANQYAHPRGRLLDIVQYFTEHHRDLSIGFQVFENKEGSNE